jgi:DNA-binding beta-propeller fold protein YncE
VVVAAALLLGGCGGLRVADAGLPPGLAWPVGEPRVRLERVVEQRRGHAGLGAVLGTSGDATPLFVRPFGVAWLGGDLLVADPGARRIVRVGADGHVQLSKPDVAGAAVGVAACAQGVVATDPEGGRVALLDLDLKRVRWLAEGLDRPTGVACEGGTVYVVETGGHRLVVLSPDGSRRVVGQRGAEPGRFNFPTAVWHSAGTLFVGDTLNFRVQRLAAADGGFLGAFGNLGDASGDMPRLKGLALDAAGHVWVSDAYLDRVSLYSTEGELLLDLGGSGSQPGRFAFPAGIAARADGRVVVADSYNQRLQVFRLVAAKGGRP